MKWYRAKFKFSTWKGLIDSIGFFSFVLILSGCSLEIQIQPLIEETVKALDSVSPSELVPSSNQGVVTSKGYEVQSSMNYYGGQAKITTVQGYEIQASVQSTLYRE